MAEQISEQEKALRQIAETLEAFPVCHMVLNLEDAAKTIRAQAEEIEQLKARGVTVEEIDRCVLGADHLADALCDILRNKGLLIESIPKVRIG